MPVISAQGVVLAATTFGVTLVAVPAALWGLSVGACVFSGKWRSFGFLAAVVVGGFGLYIGIQGLTFEVQSGMYPGEAYGAVAGILGGALLLVIGAVVGFAVSVRQRRLQR